MIYNLKRDNSFNVNSNYRFERKFRVFGLSNVAVESIVKSNTLVFYEIFNTRVVNNIYFDSLDFSGYYDNIDGNAVRKKYRIRWYGELFGGIKNPILEIKYKTGLLGSKEKYKLTSFTLDKNFNNETINYVFNNSDIPEKLKFILKSLTPTLLNSYRRKYFQSANKLYRITIDDNQLFFLIRKKYNSFLQYANDESVVLELKYDVDYDRGSEIITNQFPFRLTKNSKYVNGLNKIYDVEI